MSIQGVIAPQRQQQLQTALSAAQDAEAEPAMVGLPKPRDPLEGQAALLAGTLTLAAGAAMGLARSCLAVARRRGRWDSTQRGGPR